MENIRKNIEDYCSKQGIEVSNFDVDKTEVQDAFYKYLSFGTGGIRGIMEDGTNRINLFTIERVTQGLARSILSVDNPRKKVVIAYDSRANSYEFACFSARVLGYYGIKTYVLKELRPTP